MHRFNKLPKELTHLFRASIVSEYGTGKLQNYHIVGYIAILACFISIWAASRIVSADEYDSELEKNKLKSKYK